MTDILDFIKDAALFAAFYYPTYALATAAFSEYRVGQAFRDPYVIGATLLFSTGYGLASVFLR